MSVIGFKILQEYSGEALETQVNKLINNPDKPLDDSWQPHGPLIVERISADEHSGSHHTAYLLHYIQAMVKLE